MFHFFYKGTISFFVVAILVGYQFNLLAVSKNFT